MRLHLVFFALCIPWLACRAALAGELGELGLQRQPTQLISDRLRIRAPKGATLESRAGNIMGAPPSSEEEMRLVIEQGEERLVVLVTELFALANEDLSADARQLALAMDSDGMHPMKVEALQLKPPLRAVAMVPATPHPPEAATVVLEALVAREDGSLLDLSFYANEKAALDLQGCTDLAHRMIRSLIPGERCLDLAGGARSLGWDPHHALEIDIPPGTVLTHQPGPDFDVFRISRVGRLGEDSGFAGIYMGHHPSPQLRQMGAEVETVTTAGRIFDQDITWQGWSLARPGEEAVLFYEVIIPHPRISAIKVHVFLGAADPREAASYRTAAETLRLAQALQDEP